MSEYNHIQRAIETGYQFNLGAYFSTGWRIFTRNLPGFIGFYILYTIVTSVMSMIPCISYLFALAVSPMLVIGLSVVADLVHRNREHNFNDFFKGFSRYGDLFVANLLTSVFAGLAMVPGIILMVIAFVSMADDLNGMSGPEELFSFIFANGAFVVALIVMIAGLLAIMMWFMLAPKLIYFQRMEAWPAMMTSMKLVNKQWLNWLALLLITGILATLPFIPVVSGYIDFFKTMMDNISTSQEPGDMYSYMLESMGLGLVVALLIGAVIQPVIQCIHYAAFADITGLDRESPDMSIEDHFSVSE